LKGDEKKGRMMKMLVMVRTKRKKKDGLRLFEKLL